MSSNVIRDFLREEIEEAYEYWMNVTSVRRDDRKSIAARLAATEISTYYDDVSLNEEFKEGVLAAIDMENDEEVKAEISEMHVYNDDETEAQNENEDESEKSEQAFVDESDDGERDPLDLVIDHETVSDIKDAVRDDELSDEEIGAMIQAEDDKDNSRSTLIDWLRNRQSDEAEEEIMEIGG